MIAIPRIVSSQEIRDQTGYTTSTPEKSGNRASSSIR
jgi:hypothetical protein